MPCAAASAGIVRPVNQSPCDVSTQEFLAGAIFLAVDALTVTEKSTGRSPVPGTERHRCWHQNWHQSVPRIVTDRVESPMFVAVSPLGGVAERSNAAVQQ
jgi:hypothetical protein